MALNPAPEMGDVYLCSPETDPIGDKHGRNPRPGVVLRKRSRVCQTMMRTTKKARKEDMRIRIFSPKNENLSLNKQGWWDPLRIRPIMGRDFQDEEKCCYLGRLEGDEAEEVYTFVRDRLELLYS